MKILVPIAIAYCLGWTLGHAKGYDLGHWKALAGR